MLRHEFRPGKLVAGACFTLAGVTYLGDAGGAWETPWFAIIPIVLAGLCLAAVASLVARGIRRRGGRGPGPGQGPGRGPTSWPGAGLGAGPGTGPAEESRRPGT